MCHYYCCYFICTLIHIFVHTYIYTKYEFQLWFISRIVLPPVMLLVYCFKLVVMVPLYTYVPKPKHSFRYDTVIFLFEGFFCFSHTHTIHHFIVIHRQLLFFFLNNNFEMPQNRIKKKYIQQISLQIQWGNRMWPHHEGGINDFMRDCNAPLAMEWIYLRAQCHFATKIVLVHIEIYMKKRGARVLFLHVHRWATLCEETFDFFFSHNSVHLDLWFLW